MFRLKNVRYMALLLSLVLILSALANAGTVHAGEEQNESTEFAVTGESLGNGSEGVKESGAVGVEPSSDADTVELDGEPACSEEEVFSDSYAGILLQAEENVLEDAAEDTGTFIVTGGVYGVDYEYKDITYTNPGYGNAEGYTAGYTGQYTPPSSGQAVWTQKSLVIKSEAPLTITTSSPSDAGIYIEPGVHADLTFDNVTINAYLPVNITTNPTDPTSLHLTLADGSENLLNCTLGNTSIQAPGIRCGEGSILTIDDGRRNVDQDGNFVAPEQGLISRDAVLKDGTEVKKGDRLTLLDSEDPGSLTVNGGYRAAAIGGGPLENSGEMTFNGGEIHAYAFGPTVTNEAFGAGCGIGGGHAGGGTVMTFNGGSIDATGSYHGAGIGGGCTYTGSMSRKAVTYTFADAVLCKTPSRTIAGDIYINGGFLKSKGRIHSNAFGQGCNGTNTGKTIKITGGTLLPDSTECSSGFKDIGGAGGYVIVTGGSVRLTNNDKSKFQSSDGKAYGDEERTTEVFMTTIDLSSEGLTNNLIEHWKLYIDGELTDYGAPSMLDNGQLYLWLPKSAEGKEVRVVLSVQDENAEGGVLTPADLFITDVREGDATLKRYVEFEFPEEWEESLVKDYDGIRFSPYLLSEENFLLTVEEPAKRLTDPSKMSYKYQYYGEDGETLTGAELGGLPADSGTFQIVMTSTQYSADTEFSKSYWGHRAYGSAVINPVESSITATMTGDDEVSNLADHVLHVTADIVSGEGTAETCAAPTGSVQLYIDGRAVGDPVRLTDGLDGGTPNAVFSVTPDAGDNRYHTTFSYDFTTVSDDDSEWAPGIKKGGRHEVSLVYLPDKNYLSSSSDPVSIIGTGKIHVRALPDGSAPDVEAVYGDNVLEKIVKYEPYEEEKVFLGWTTDPKEGIVNITEDTEMGDYDITVYPVWEAKTTVDKEVDNLDNDDKTSVGDGLLYTITIKNVMESSLWEDVNIDDKLPKGVNYLPGSAQLTYYPDKDSEGTVTQLPDSIYKKSTHSIVYQVGNVLGGEIYLLQFRVIVGAQAVSRDEPENADITNTVNVTGKNPDGSDNLPTDPDGPYNPDGSGGTDEPDNPGGSGGSGGSGGTDDPDNPDGSGGSGGSGGTDEPDNPGGSSATPPGGTSVTPRDPRGNISKTAENKTDPGSRTQVGDTIQYTITVRNDEPGSLWTDVTVLDLLPEHLQPDPDSIFLTYPDGTRQQVDAGAYDSAARKIGVYIGDIYGEEEFRLTFEALVLPDAAGQDIGNSAWAVGGGPGGTTGGSTPDPGDPYFPPEGDDGTPQLPDGTPATQVVDIPKPVYPSEDDKPDGEGGGVLPADPEPDVSDPKLDKTVQDLTHSDGIAHMDDLLEYKVQLTNEELGKQWKNIMIFDYLPKTLEVDIQSLTLTEPDGTVTHLSEEVYDNNNRMICVPIAEINGGETYTLTYRARVLKIAPSDTSQSIVNNASASGDGPDGGDSFTTHGQAVIPIASGTLSGPSTGDSLSAIWYFLLMLGASMVCIVGRKYRKS